MPPRCAGWSEGWSHRHRAAPLRWSAARRRITRSSPRSTPPRAASRQCSTRCSPPSRSQTLPSPRAPPASSGLTPSTATLRSTAAPQPPLYIVLAAVGTFSAYYGYSRTGDCHEALEAARKRAQGHRRPTGPVATTPPAGPGVPPGPRRSPAGRAAAARATTTACSTSAAAANCTATGCSATTATTGCTERLSPSPDVPVVS